MRGKRGNQERVSYLQVFRRAFRDRIDFSHEHFQLLNVARGDDLTAGRRGVISTDRCRRTRGRCRCRGRLGLLWDMLVIVARL